jgi:hypothetical protein
MLRNINEDCDVLNLLLVSDEEFSCYGFHKLTQYLLLGASES